MSIQAAGGHCPLTPAEMTLLGDRSAVSSLLVTFRYAGGVPPRNYKPVPNPNKKENYR
jgi:hypothetical protein